MDPDEGPVLETYHAYYAQQHLTYCQASQLVTHYLNWVIVVFICGHPRNRRVKKKTPTASAPWEMGSDVAATVRAVCRGVGDGWDQNLCRVGCHVRPCPRCVQYVYTRVPCLCSVATRLLLLLFVPFRKNVTRYYYCCRC